LAFAKSKFTENNSPTWKHLNHTAGTSQGGFEDHYDGEAIPTPAKSFRANTDMIKK
jgi:hypothetical protein